MKAIQKFTDEYLDRCSAMTPDQIIRFLEDFRRLHGRAPARSRLISMKVPEDLLAAFKAKSGIEGVPYQTQIKALMRAWILSGE